MFSHPRYRPSLLSGHFKDLHAAPQRKSITACCLHDESLNSKDVMEGKFHVVYGTPEAWTQVQWKVLHTKTYQEKVLLIVADEAHCIPKW